MVSYCLDIQNSKPQQNCSELANITSEHICSCLWTLISECLDRSRVLPPGTVWILPDGRAVANSDLPSDIDQAWTTWLHSDLSE